jgi:hypothetical protein
MVQFLVKFITFAYKVAACSIEVISQISQPATSVFLSQKTSQPGQPKRTGFE